ncbi:MAG: hypothetical protein AAGD32_04265 [Planctomycetota bacterium]
MRWIIAVALATLGMSFGCSENAVNLGGGGVLAIAKPDNVFADERYFTLLDAEMQSDQFFTRSERTYGDAFGGQYGFAVDGELSVPLGNLWPGGDQVGAVPGIWQLLAWYVRPRFDGPVTLTLLHDGSPVSSSKLDLRADLWQPIAVDLQPLRDMGIDRSGGLLLRLTFDGTADELMLVDNQRDLHDNGWTVAQRGLVRNAGGIDLIGVEPVVEANDLRFRAGGETVYRNGQRYTLGRQLPTPGKIVGPDVRVVRTSPTDIDGDGFDDGRGAFVLVVNEPRAALMLEPRRPITDPAFEMTGLPPGEVIVTFAGALSAQHTRLPDGTVLFVLPGTFEQATPIQIRVR